MTGIIYGSTTGNTENIAKILSSKIEDAELINVTDIDGDTFEKFDTILIGSSTWGSGDLQDDWESGIEVLKSADLSGKKIAVFGCGDQEMYADTFGNAVAILYNAAKESGAEIVGQTSADGYSFDSSEALVDGSLVGLLIDEDNQSDLTSGRIDAWLSSIC